MSLVAVAGNLISTVSLRGTLIGCLGLACDRKRSSSTRSTPTVAGRPGAACRGFST